MFLKATELLPEDVLVYPILVTCPGCKAKATVTAKNFSTMQWDAKDVRVVCASCGYYKELKDFPTQMITNSQGKKTPVYGYSVGIPFDPFFKIPLFLQTKCCGDVLWAYNSFHIEILKEYVATKLRKRSTSSNLNRSIASRLPQWIKSSGNREQVLKGLEALEKMV